MTWKMQREIDATTNVVSWCIAMSYYVPLSSLITVHIIFGRFGWTYTNVFLEFVGKHRVYVNTLLMFNLFMEQEIWKNLDIVYIHFVSNDLFPIY